MPKVKGLTDKEKLYLKEYTSNGFNSTKACLKAYNVKDYQSANALASRVHKRLVQVSQEQPDALNSSNPKEESILKRLNPEYILSHIEEIALDRKAPKHTRLKALELLGKFKDLGLWREYQVRENIPNLPSTQEDLDKQYLQLIDDKTS